MLKKILLELVSRPLQTLRLRRERLDQRQMQHALDLLNKHRYDDVVALCRQKLRTGVRSSYANNLCGHALSATGRHDEALVCFREAAERSVSNKIFQFDLALAMDKAGQTEAAVRQYRVVVSLDPDNLDFRLALIDCLERNGMFEDSVPELLLAQHMAPHRKDLLLKCFSATSRIGLHQEMLRLAEHAAITFGDGYDSYRLLALARYAGGDMDGAVEACREALKFRHNDPDMLVTLGASLLEVGDAEGAEIAYRQAVASNPAHPDAVFQLGLMNLALGRYRDGWEGYEWRLRRSRSTAIRSCEPRWHGEELREGRLLVMREQGLGDEIMYASCYADLLKRASRIIFECEPRLQRLFSRSFPGVEFRALDKDRRPVLSPDESSDAMCIYAGSLPGFFRPTSESFPLHQGYLKTDPEKVLNWRQRLSGLGPGLKVGISWMGGKRMLRRERRSVALRQMLPLLGVEGVQWVNLQYGQRQTEIAALRDSTGVPIVDWPEAIDGDYDDTASLVAALDLVITVCTSVAHLTGAIGQRGWVLSPKVPEWRYGLNASHISWYPSLTLFRQDVQGEWGGVLEKVTAKLADVLQKRTVNP